MNDERREYIRNQLYQETGDPESQAWRDELTPEEMEYVERLDGRYATGIAAMCAAILVREKVRERYRPAEVVGRLACLAGLLDRPEPAAAAELVPLFSWDKVPKRDIILA